VIWGIVLAAGLGRRIGGPKALLSLDGRTFLERAVRAFTEAGLEVVVVVNPVVDAAVPKGALSARLVVNPDPDQQNGMFGSVRLGVCEALKLGARGALLLPVDLPLVTSEDVRAVVTRLNAGAAVVVATPNRPIIACFLPQAREAGPVMAMPANEASTEATAR